MAAKSTSASSSQTKKPGTTVKSSSTSASAKKKAAATRTAKSRMQMAPTADRIMEIQTALAASDSYKGEPSGKWDDASVAAMKHFQQVNGLNPSGKLDALSLQKLGLGSDTAGRGAPRPAKPAGSAPSSTTPSIQR
jgi:peptidoglycan hydrolase-like protein with peptidoglycan-binding domain